MKKWNEYMQESRSRGSLAFEVFRLVTTPTGNQEAFQDALPAHIDFLKAAEEAGTFMLAGPLSDESGKAMEGEGMIIFKAESMKDAIRFADSDPMHSSGARAYTLRKWAINEGVVQLSVKVAGQSVNFD